MCFSLSVANESKFVANAYSLHLLYIFSGILGSGEGQAKRTNTKRALDKAIFIKISFRWAAKVLRLLDGNVRDVKGTRRMLATVIDSDRAR